MPRRAGRVQACDREDAATRLAHAQKFYDAAELVAREDNVPAAMSVAAALAVLDGIAASDAACCAALGQRSRGQDPKQAEALVRQVEPGGAEAGKSLARLLDLKDTAHYGLIHVSAANLKTALRHASHLIDFATKVARR